MNLLVIGYGNELRGDDGVGPRVARVVAAWALPGVEALAVHGLTPELAEPIGRADTVVFVDAGCDGDVVELRELHPRWAPGLGHTSEPAYLLALAERIAGRAPRAWLVVIPGSAFELGEAVSAQAERGMTTALGIIRRVATGGIPCTKSA